MEFYFNQADILKQSNPIDGHKEFRKQLKKLQLKLHPDKHPGQVKEYTEKFQRFKGQEEILNELFSSHPKNAMQVIKSLAQLDDIGRHYSNNPFITQELHKATENLYQQLRLDPSSRVSEDLYQKIGKMISRDILPPWLKEKIPSLIKNERLSVLVFELGNLSKREVKIPTVSVKENPMRHQTHHMYQNAPNRKMQPQELVNPLLKAIPNLIQLGKFTNVIANIDQIFMSLKGMSVNDIMYRLSVEEKMVEVLEPCIKTAQKNNYRVSLKELSKIQSDANPYQSLREFVKVFAHENAMKNLENLHIKNIEKASLNGDIGSMRKEIQGLRNAIMSAPQEILESTMGEVYKRVYQSLEPFARDAIKQNLPNSAPLAKELYQGIPTIKSVIKFASAYEIDKSFEKRKNSKEVHLNFNRQVN
jgi:hypothetical protein